MAILSKSLTALTILMTLSACTPLIKDVQKSVNTEQDKANKLVDVARQPSLAAPNSSVRYADKVWVGSQSFRSANGDALPTRFSQVSLSSNDSLTLSEIAAEITAMTGLMVSVDSGSSDTASGGGQSYTPPAADSAESGDVTSTAAAGDGSVPYIPPTSIGSSTGEPTMSITYSGPLRGLLDEVAARFGYSWEYSEGGLYFSRYKTRTFALHALPGSSEIVSNINASTTSGSQSGQSDTLAEAGSTQSTQITSSLTFWTEMKEAVDTMVPEGSKVSLSPTTGTLTVSTTAAAMRQVEDFVEKQNNTLTRQVAITVQVLSVTTTDRDNYALDLTGAFTQLNNDFGFNFTGPRINDITRTTVGSIGATILNPPANPALAQWNTSDAFIQALSTKRNVALVTSAAVTTLNNQAVPVQVVERRAYLRSATTTITDTTSSTELEPGTVTTGFIVNVLPRILANGEILMQYSLSLSEISNFESFTTPNSRVDLPTVTSRDFLQQVRIKSGQTLVLAGFDRDNNDMNKAGTGTPDNLFPLGGARNGARDRQVIIILISPQQLQ